MPLAGYDKLYKSVKYMIYNTMFMRKKQFCVKRNDKRKITTGRKNKTMKKKTWYYHQILFLETDGHGRCRARDKMMSENTV